jgi:hypothetical protein
VLFLLCFVMVAAVDEEEEEHETAPASNAHPVFPFTWDHGVFRNATLAQRQSATLVRTRLCHRSCHLTNQVLSWRLY